MKVGVYLPGRISRNEGGGFSYLERLIEAIDKYHFNDSLSLCFVGRQGIEGEPFLKQYCKISSYRFYFFFRIFDRLGITAFFQRILNRNIDLCNLQDKKILKRNNIDILLFPVQLVNEVKGFPFISMNWDVGHLSSQALPEFVSFQDFHFRQKWYRDDLLKAIAVFTESKSGRKELVQYTGINSSKVYVIPIFPGKVVELKVDENQQQVILKNIGVAYQEYFFYPAQFWAHKNHYNLLIAFKKLLEFHPNLKLVFTGSDKGNKTYIVDLVNSMGLNDSVLILGFVSNDEVYTLYKSAIALVMPTLLGQTNMPLLEAQCIGVPVICSDFFGHREQCKNAALYVDAADPESIYLAMQKILFSDIRNTLLAEAQLVNETTIFTVKNAIEALEKALLRIIAFRMTFSR